MNKREFLNQRKPVWRRFEGLVDMFDTRVVRGKRPPVAETERPKKKVRESEIAEFSRLFREITNDLATVRSRAWGEGVALYLNDLLARAHNCFYSAPPTNLQTVVKYLTVDFPQLFRRNFGYFLTAALLFFVPLALSWAIVQNDPLIAERILPGAALEQFKSMYSKKEKKEAGNKNATADASQKSDGSTEGKTADADKEKPGDSKEEDEEDEDFGKFEEQRTVMFGFYIRNNVGIAFRCFALGVLLGVGTVYVLLYNGIVIGAVAGYVCSLGSPEKFLTFVFSHGSFELTAIAVAGGAGLMLGNAIVHPGNRGRWEALPVRALEAVQIAVGAGVMLVIAALIEAYWSPSGLPSVVKFAGGSLMWISVFLYLGLAGRDR